MPYLGNHPTANFATVTKDTFNGNASSYTLSKPATTNGVAVYVENVRQIPTTAYSVSGTTLTFTGTTPAGTNNVYVLHHNTPVSTATHPSAQDLTAANATLTGAVTVGGTSNLTITDGDLVVGTSGHGISFAATSDATDMSSELLDDYEEGTFTYGSNANIGFQSNTNVGKYTKIGNMVHLQIQVDLASVSSTNHFYLSGMPFTAGSHTTNTYNGQSTGTCMIYNINTYWAGSQFCSYIGQGSTNMYFYETYDNSNWSIVTNSRITSTSEMIISHTYFV